VLQLDAGQARELHAHQMRVGADAGLPKAIWSGLALASAM
jgi:hypothetical protein